MITEKLVELSQEIEKLAKKVKFIQYSTSKISGVEFVHLMSTIIFSAGLTKTLEEQCEDLKREFNIKITPVSLSNKQNKKEASIFLKRVYKLLLRNNIEEIIVFHPKSQDNFKNNLIPPQISYLTLLFYTNHHNPDY